MWPHYQDSHYNHNCPILHNQALKYYLAHPWTTWTSWNLEPSHEWRALLTALKVCLHHKAGFILGLKLMRRGLVLAGEFFECIGLIELPQVCAAGSVAQIIYEQHASALNGHFSPPPPLSLPVSVLSRQKLLWQLFPGRRSAEISHARRTDSHHQPPLLGGEASNRAWREVTVRLLGVTMGSYENSRS